MSAAPEHLSRRWQRILAVLGVCLPIPLFAATGLSIPLPAPVERIAAALVPWADAAALVANEALAPGARGSIVLLAGEGLAGGPGEADATSAARDERLSLGGSDDDDGGGGGATKAGDGDSSGGGSGGGGGDPTTTDGEGDGAEEPTTTDPGGGGEEPTDDTTVVEDTVETVEETADEVVETGDGLVEDVGGTVDETEAMLNETLDGLGN